MKSRITILIVNTSIQAKNERKIEKFSSLNKIKTNNYTNNKIPIRNSTNTQTKPPIIPKNQKHNKHPSTATQPSYKLNSQLKYNSANNNNIDINESGIFSQITIENPKEVYYLPQKVNYSCAIPKNIPKLNIQHPLDENIKIQIQSETPNQSMIESLGSPNNLNNAFVNIESLTISEKKGHVNSHIDEELGENVNQMQNDTKNNFHKSNSLNSTKPSSKQNFVLNFENLPKADYHKEFIEQFEDFSPSWRKECLKMKGFVPK